MFSTADTLFLLGVVFLLIHELDAVQQGEWRFFFAWLRASDETKTRLFNAAHVPLLLLVLANLATPSFQLGLDIFLVAHAGIHWVLRHHPLIAFNNRFSRIWIFGGALLGLAHAIMLLSA